MDAVLERKYRALEEFTARVRSHPVGDQIARMILYGSVLRGDAGPESDVDLLVVASRAFIVNEPIVEPGVGRAFRQALDWRNRARYDPHATLTEADAEDVIGVAEKLANLLQQEVYGP
jgi:predicted nucleotidyltransferase